MALRRAKVISRVPQKSLTYEEKAALNKIASEKGEELPFPWVRSDFSKYQNEIEQTLVNDVIKSDLWHKLANNISAQIVNIKNDIKKIIGNTHDADIFLYKYSTTDVTYVNDAKEMITFAQKILSNLEHIKKTLYKDSWSDTLIDKLSLEYIETHRNQKMLFLCQHSPTNFTKKQLLKDESLLLDRIISLNSALRELLGQEFHDIYNNFRIEKQHAHLIQSKIAQYSDQFEDFLSELLSDVIRIERELLLKQGEVEVSDAIKTILASKYKKKTILALFNPV